MIIICIHDRHTRFYTSIRIRQPLAIHMLSIVKLPPDNEKSESVAERLCEIHKNEHEIVTPSHCCSSSGGAHLHRIASFSCL